MTTTRAELLARVRTALGSERHRPSTEVGVLDPLTRLCAPAPTLAQTFLDRAAAAGCRVHQCRAAAVHSTIAGFLRDATARGVVLGVADQRLRLMAQKAIADAGARCEDAAMLDADTGITDADAAMAETGSVVIASGPHRPRTASFGPLVHIVLVPASRVVPDLLDLWPRSAAREATPSSLVLISGPSKTADIEGILITGVHGPSVVHVLLVEDL